MSQGVEIIIIKIKYINRRERQMKRLVSFKCEINLE